MKTSKYIQVILLFSIGLTFSLQAEDTIQNRSVSVEREYRPVIHDAGKINSMPQVLEPNVVKTPAVYSDFNLPLNAGFNIHTLPAAELVPEKPLNTNNGYARLGIGNYLNTLADFAYPLINAPDTRLDFSLNHLATFDAKEMHTTTKANLAFDEIFKTFDLYAGIGGGHEAFRYYGNYFNGADSIMNLNTLASKYGYSLYSEKNRVGINTTPGLYNLNMLSNDPDGDTFWRFNVKAGVRSLPTATDLRYQAEIQYKAFSAVNGITENMVHTQAGFSSVSEKNRLGLDLELFNMMYSSTSIPDFNFWKDYSVLTLNPYYSIERPAYSVRLGLKSSLSFVHGKFMNPSADVLAEWKAIPQYVSLYGGLTGNYDVNTLDKTFSENPYLISDLRVNDTYTPVDVYAGIKLKPLYNLLLDAYIDYRQIDNQYFFVNKGYSLINSSVTMPASDTTLYSNRFNVVYSSATHVKMGFRANYNYKSLVNVELKWAYNSWNVASEPYAWNMPKYDAQLNTDIHINDNVTVSANLYYEGDRFAKLGYSAVKMNDKVDINFGVAYSYNNWLTVFGKINNLINNQYQDYYGYDVQGINAMVGVAFSF
jgi:hypothetical protein